MNNKLQLQSRTGSRIRANRRVRTCLMCGRGFRSEGPHNRRCPRCNCRFGHAREGSCYAPTVYSVERNIIDSFDRNA